MLVLVALKGLKCTTGGLDDDNGSIHCTFDGKHTTGMQDEGRHLPADFVGLEFALLVVGLVGVVAAVVLALVTVAAVALLSRLHQPVATDGLARF